MAGSGGRAAPPAAAGDDRNRAINWEAAERSPAFQELVARRRRFVVPATIGFMAWYFGFILLAGYAEGFMGESIYQGFTVGYALALTQFLMTWGLGWLYLRRSERVFEPLRLKALEAARGEVGDGRAPLAPQTPHDPSVSHAGATQPDDPSGPIPGPEERR